MFNNRNNKLARYNPFREMESLEKSVFGNMFDFFNNSDLSAFKTDIIDDNDKYILKADLPGFEKEDIHLDIDENTLILNAERHSEFEDKDRNGKYLRCERSYGTYSRTFDLSNVKADEIKASYENGVLQLIMPKKEAKSSSVRKIDIE